MSTLTRRYSSDAFMLKLRKCLVGDFRSMGLPEYCSPEIYDGLSSRDVHFPDKLTAPVHIFKMQYQLENLFKRYRFDHDKFTQKDLEESTLKKFKESQIRIGKLSVDSLPLQTKLVLQKARSIIKEALGDFSEDELRSSCKFGSRASKGCSLAKSYLDLKLGEPLTGSAEQVRWFSDYLSTDKILYNVLSEEHGSPKYTSCTSLNVSLAAKSYKALRLIMPNSTIGSFRSNGLGKLLVEALKSVNIYLSTGQRKHQLLAQVNSITRNLVTGDLSSASDSYWCALMNLLLPRKWYNELKLGRISQCNILNEEGGVKEQLHLTSFMTMGIGFTFPLQTLCFYAIIKAVICLLDGKGLVSVFGDDLIYPRKYHWYVGQVFESLGFVYNPEKTFVQSYFRESCGGDYYHGANVRPFQPEGQATYHNRLSYLSLLYKTLNGLRRRWDNSEIPSTIHFIWREILRIDREILLVPPLFPDYSGMRVDEYEFSRIPWYVPHSRPRATWGPYQAYCFKFLRLAPRDRLIKSQYAYYWDAMRVKIEDWEDPLEGIQTIRTAQAVEILKEPRVEDLNDILSLIDNNKLYNLRDILRVEHWLEDKPEGKQIHWTNIHPTTGKREYRRTSKGKRVPRLFASVPDKKRKPIFGYTLGATSSWSDATITG